MSHASPNKAFEGASFPLKKLLTEAFPSEAHRRSEELELIKGNGYDVGNQHHQLI